MANRSSLGASSTDDGEDSGLARVPPVTCTSNNEYSDDWPSPQMNTAESAEYERVLKSDIGITTLLVRLKQSIASARDFATFLKKRSILEEEQAQGLKKLCRHTHESTRRPDNRQGSYAHNYEEITRIQDRMADNGVQFALSLHLMHEDLAELTAEKERGRKQWKQSGLSAEKRVQDAELAMEKAKTKYDSLAEDFERARTGDKQAGRVFGLKGPKSAAQVEEDLNRKVQAADADYASKVQLAQGLRTELVSTSRPQAVKALHDLITECDAGLLLQMQKFASFHEKLLLSNGLCVSPLKTSAAGNGMSTRSLRDVVFSIDSKHDLHSYVRSFAPKLASIRPELKYERHPIPQANTSISSTTASQTQAMSKSQVQQPLHAPTHPQDYPSYRGDGGPDLGSISSTRQLNSAPTGNNNVNPPSYTSSTPSQHYPQTHPASGTPNSPLHSELPPLKPVFGVSLEDLFNRDGSAVPMLVHQCLQAVDLFGLEVEGIYRTSGTASHITKLRAIFNNDSLQVDFRNPENFYHDVNSVAGLLKLFLRDLPDPLLTREHYQGFVEAARIDDDFTRRDSLHATINSLPDPNYATLRALILHLNRVQEHSSANRMNAGNLAICFGPTLMGSSAGPNVADAGWQVRVIDTILQNTYQIFDED